MGRARLTRFEEGALHLVWDRVTGDEIWIYCYDPKTKQQSTVWVSKDEPKPTKLARERSCGSVQIRTVTTSGIEIDSETRRGESQPRTEDGTRAKIESGTETRVK
ncbi:hypothetical protein EVAR_78701_1 [Eumeta japonica]|uniref:Uncharacterized protein n=1 Tax=Eumeta variegata TaxID=151549 RepID=A0A4C1T1Y5_EUMVA|nr:hypothetical protein EVAR_78701_1 [Eumeta japonica]